jgi:type III restriction enzyme
MIETKKEGDIDTAEVQEKSQAALTYCNHATEFTTQNGGKPWKYILIPHDAVKVNMGFDTLVKRFECGQGISDFSISAMSRDH